MKRENHSYNSYLELMRCLVKEVELLNGFLKEEDRVKIIKAGGDKIKDK